MHTFRENFLSDPSTYPIIVITGFAYAFMAGMAYHGFAHYKDIRIAPSKKHSEIRTWTMNGDPHAVAKAVAIRNSYYRPIYTEGLGVNHEDWLRAHEAAN